MSDKDDIELVRGCLIPDGIDVHTEELAALGRLEASLAHLRKENAELGLLKLELESANSDLECRLMLADADLEQYR